MRIRISVDLRIRSALLSYTVKTGRAGAGAGAGSIAVDIPQSVSTFRQQNFSFEKAIKIIIIA